MSNLGSRNLTRLAVTAALIASVSLAGCVSPPENLICSAKDSGNFLDWDEDVNATGYRVYRAVGDDPFTLIGETTDTQFLDTNVTAEVTYKYRVTSISVVPIDGQEPQVQESEPSECEVTAVPFFAGIALISVAVLGSVTAYVVLRRRR